jgi:hypothetical protein
VGGSSRSRSSQRCQPVVEGKGREGKRRGLRDAPEEETFSREPFPQAAANNHRASRGQRRWKLETSHCSNAERRRRNTPCVLTAQAQPARRGEGKRFPLLARLAPLA